jgi:hypothetical protein
MVTEASNLLGYIDDPIRSRIYTVFRNFLADTDEIYSESKRAAQHKAFVRLGVTDAVLLNVGTSRHIILTADLDLYLTATR